MTVSALVVLATSAVLQVDEARLKAALDATELKYAKTESGKNYTIVFDHPNNRKQTVYMAVAPYKPTGLTMINFYTTVWTGRSLPDASVIKKALSSSRKMGCFYLFKGTNDVWAIRFQAKFDATDLKASWTKDDPQIIAMKDLIYLVNAAGEEMDKELNGSKDIDK